MNIQNLNFTVEELKIFAETVKRFYLCRGILL